MASKKVMSSGLTPEKEAELLSQMLGHVNPADKIEASPNPPEKVLSSGLTPAQEAEMLKKMMGGSGVVSDANKNISILFTASNSKYTVAGLKYTKGDKVEKVVCVYECSLLQLGKLPRIRKESLVGMAPLHKFSPDAAGITGAIKAFIPTMTSKIDVFVAKMGL